MKRTMISALTINRIPRLGWKQKKALLETFGGTEQFIQLEKSYLTAAFGWRTGPLDMLSLMEEAKREYHYCRDNSIDITVLGCRDYPEILSQIYDPPFVLYSRGRKLEQDFSGTAVVGTRKPTGNGITQAFQVGLDLALRECPVVSGLALGIDGAAHRGALSGWGWTVGVLASGVDNIFPRSHQKLAWEMLETGGTLVSEYCPGTVPQKYRYPQRNRIISGLSMVSIVIQAPLRSGSLITADFALQEGRDVLVASSGMDVEGSRELASQGATVIERGRELLTLLGVDTEIRPGLQMHSPRHHREVTQRLEDELQGNLISYGGRQYHAI